jgi:hypothetical protein
VDGLKAAAALMAVVAGAALALAVGPAEAQRPVVTITATGPAWATPGEAVEYQFAYVIEGGPGSDIAATWSGERVAYVSQRVVSGGGRVATEPGVGDVAGVVRWSLPQGSGTVAMTLQIPTDLTSGTITAGAYEPGTDTTHSNSVTTTILPAAAPATGGGLVTTRGAALPAWLAGLVIAAALAAAATSTRLVMTGLARR